VVEDGHVLGTELWLELKMGNGGPVVRRPRLPDLVVLLNLWPYIQGVGEIACAQSWKLGMIPRFHGHAVRR
jgi:hypothetical protein